MSQHLQEIILYGIAMADTPQDFPQQQPKEQQQQQAVKQVKADTTAAPEESAPLPSTATCQGTATTTSSNSSSSRVWQRLITASEGRRTLQLYAQSVGRYNSQGGGAFMVPCYGSGSLPEAFVRVAAVAGAVTVLRCGAQAVEAGDFRVEQPVKQQQQLEGVGKKEEVEQQEEQRQQEEGEMVHGEPGGVDQGSIQQQQQQEEEEEEEGLTRVGENAAGVDGVGSTSSSSTQEREGGHRAVPVAAAAAAGADGDRGGPNADCSSTAIAGLDVAAADASGVGPAPGTAAATASITEIVQRGYKVTTTAGQPLYSDVVVGEASALGLLLQQQGEQLQQQQKSATTTSTTTSSSSQDNSYHHHHQEQFPGGDELGGNVSSTEAVAQAVVVMDKSLVEGESLLVFAMPPGALGEQQKGVIRGLQLGPEAHLAPAGKKLLYLSTPCGPWGEATGGSTAAAAAVSDGAGGCESLGGRGAVCIGAPAAAAAGTAAEGQGGGADAAEALLATAVEALVDMSGLDAEQGAACSSSGKEDGSSRGRVNGGGVRPNALAVMYFMRRIADARSSSCGVTSSSSSREDRSAPGLQSAGAAVEDENYTAEGAAAEGAAAAAKPLQAATEGAAAVRRQLPACCIPCPGADAGMMGYEAMTAAVQVLMQQYLPGVPWITESAEQRDAAGAVVDDEEEEAIDELTKALQELSAV